MLPSDWINGGGHAHRNAIQRFLRELSIYREFVGSIDSAAARQTWLLPFRDDFRRMRFDETVGALRASLYSGDPKLRHVFIWLLSENADRFRLRGISDFRNDPSPKVRRHVAKALRRLEAWSLLEEMALAYPSDMRIQWYAQTPTTRRPFRERLRNYTRTVDDAHAGEVVTPSRMPFWRLEGDWEGRAPKSVWYIRLMLQRIRRWVRGI